MIKVNDFPSLTDELQGIFNETAATEVADMVGKDIFEVRDTNRRTFDHLVLHGVSGVEEVTPGQDLPKVNTDEGDSITYTQRYFGAEASVTKEMRKFDLHDQIEGLVRTIAEDAFNKVDQSYADVLLYGWSTSYTDVYGKSVSSVGPNGKALFNASHSNGVSTSSNTFSNIANDGTNSNPALSRAALVETRTRARRLKDPVDVNRPTKLDTLIIGPGNEDLAERIVYSTQQSGTANNDTNPLKGKIKSIMVWDRLDERSDGTDTSAYWFMADSRKMGETLKSTFAERPTLDAPEQVYSNKNWDYSVDFFYTVGLGYQKYVFGSKGDNS